MLERIQRPGQTQGSNLPSVVLRDPLRGGRPEVSSAEEVHVFFSFVGDTLCRQNETEVNHRAIRLKRALQGALIITPASAM